MIEKESKVKKSYETCSLQIVKLTDSQDVVTTSGETVATKDPYRDDIFTDSWTR